MNFRWTPEALAAFEAKRKKWDATGAVRTHKIRDDGHERAGRVRPKLQVVMKLTERQVQRACLNALEVHPKVAFAWRQNTGALQDKRGITVRFAFRGCADILGCMRDGRFLAVECKATGKYPTPDQMAFLRRVTAAGGIAVWADDPSKLIAALDGEGEKEC